MSVIVPTSYSDLRGLQIRPGAEILDSTWQTLAQNAHHVYARGSERHPIYWKDAGIDTTSSTYEQPAPLDAITAVWRPTRPSAANPYRLTLLIYGDDVDVRATVYDATVGTNTTVDTAVASAAAGGEWATAQIDLTEGEAIDSSEPIPLGLSFEIKTSGEATGTVYQIHLVSEILTSATLP